MRATVDSRPSIDPFDWRKEGLPSKLTPPFCPVPPSSDSQEDGPPSIVSLDQVHMACLLNRVMITVIQDRVDSTRWFVPWPHRSSRASEDPLLMVFLCSSLCHAEVVIAIFLEYVRTFGDAASVFRMPDQRWRRLRSACNEINLHNIDTDTKVFASYRARENRR